MSTHKELEVENPEAPGGNKHCLQCGWTYPVPGHAPGCNLAHTKMADPAVAKMEKKKLPEPPAVPFPKPEVKKED